MIKTEKNKLAALIQNPSNHKSLKTKSFPSKIKHLEIVIVNLST